MKNTSLAIIAALLTLISSNVSAIDFTKGEVAVMIAYDNGNIAFQLASGTNPIQLHSANCLSEDIGRGAGAVFLLNFGNTAKSNERLHAALLAAQATDKKIQVSYNPNPSGYCIVDRVWTYLDE